MSAPIGTDEMLDRIEELEAELAKATKALEGVRSFTVELEQAESDNILLIARIEELEAELEHWREEADLGWDKAEERRTELAKAVRLMEVSVEVARWELDLDLRDSVIDFLAELKGEK